MTKPKIKEVNWFNFDHAAVKKKLDGAPEFIREFSIKDQTWAVYKVMKPNRKKKHKDYMLLTSPYAIEGIPQVLISGMDKKEMKNHRYQTSILCKNCNSLLYSVNVHDCHTCECSNETMIDGGKDYLRYGGKDMNLIEIVMLDLLTSKFKKLAVLDKL